MISGGQELLQAILDNPQDPLLRLVYADWLEDQERVEAAAFVRETADRIPYRSVIMPDVYVWWNSASSSVNSGSLCSFTLNKLSGVSESWLFDNGVMVTWKRYNTYNEAMLALFRAGDALSDD